MGDQVSHPHKTTGKVTVWDILIIVGRQEARRQRDSEPNGS
jgi:hypothetical protein